MIGVLHAARQFFSGKPKRIQASPESIATADREFEAGLTPMDRIALEHLQEAYMRGNREVWLLYDDHIARMHSLVDRGLADYMERRKYGMHVRSRFRITHAGLLVLDWLSRAALSKAT